MNPAYIQTFRRHRALFLVPIAVAGFIALWSALGAQKLYRSTSGLWLDTTGGTTYQALGAPSPAADGQTMLNELLRTEYFAKTIANQGPLGDYLEEHPSAGWGPGALLGKMRGTPTMDERIATALGPSRVTSSVQGPHVLQIKFDGPSPQLAVATLRVILDEFEKQSNSLRRDALAAARTRVKAASDVLQTATAALRGYRELHPGAGASDPQFNALAQNAQSAETALGTATQTLNEALAGLAQGAENTLRVLDQPRLPLGSTQGKRRIAMTMFAGLFGGAVFSILGIVVLTSRTRGFRLSGGPGDPEAAVSTNGHNGRDLVQAVAQAVGQEAAGEGAVAEPAGVQKEAAAGKAVGGRPAGARRSRKARRRK
ncbi:MAG TPA: hypothetical protein VFW80_12210 [Gaiellaceae bacterium]|nr:hypothetical protein [Gaiellaceae bacterium]